MHYRHSLDRFDRYEDTEISNSQEPPDPQLLFFLERLTEIFNNEWKKVKRLF